MSLAAKLDIKSRGLALGFGPARAFCFWGHGSRGHGLRGGITPARIDPRIQVAMIVEDAGAEFEEGRTSPLQPPPVQAADAQAEIVCRRFDVETSGCGSLCGVERHGVTSFVIGDQPVIALLKVPALDRAD